MAAVIAPHLDMDWTVATTMDLTAKTLMNVSVSGDLCKFALAAEYFPFLLFYHGGIAGGLFGGLGRKDPSRETGLGW